MATASTLGELNGGGALAAPYDEAFASPGQPRPHYEALIAAIESAGPAELDERVTASATAAGVGFAGGEFRLDPVPRLLTAAEWETVSAAARQRARALDSFLADAYGERRIVTAGIVPERVISGAEHHEPLMRGVEVAPGAWASVVGLDLIREPGGGFLVLEDNARSPSGTGFAVAARHALAALGLPGVPLGSPSEAFAALAEALRAAAPGGGGDPSMAILSEGPQSAAFYEHELLARELEIPLVTPTELETSGGRLRARLGARTRQIDVIYRRIEEERLSAPDGSPTALGSLLAEPLRAGRLACVNAFGSGLADDKLTHAYIEKAIGFYLGEEPVIRSVPTFDLGDHQQLAESLARLEELVVKPRAGLGGGGVLIGPLAGTEALADARRRIKAEPEAYVAQETISLSTHPSAVGDGLAARRVDLRPFAIIAGDRVSAPASALTRYARGAGEMIVNSSHGGGAKDTWVLAAS
jgi:uncharacterized circularly permuted ATP-grasp superfamily protein